MESNNHLQQKHYNKSCTVLFLRHLDAVCMSFCPNMSDRPVGAGGAGGTVGAMAPTDQLTLSQPGVQIYPPHYKSPPPDCQTSFDLVRDVPTAFIIGRAYTWLHTDYFISYLQRRGNSAVKSWAKLVKPHILLWITYSRIKARGQAT